MSEFFYILIVDDELELRELLKESLEAAYPCVVMQADDGEEARKLVRTCVFDLIIADIFMPRCDGVEFYQWIMENQPGLHANFIFLTAAGREAKVLKRLRELPPVPLLHKPFYIQDLIKEADQRLPTRKLRESKGDRGRLN